MSNNSDFSIFKSIYAAFFILVVHLVLVGGIGILVLFFYGIINHTIWMVLAISGILSGGGYLFFKYLKSDTKGLADMVNNSLKNGRAVEVSFLGGIANFRISNQRSVKAEQKKLTGRSSAGNADIYELSELATLYEKRLITSEEYEKAKQKLFKKDEGFCKP